MNGFVPAVKIEFSRHDNGVPRPRRNNRGKTKLQRFVRNLTRSSDEVALLNKLIPGLSHVAMSIRERTTLNVVSVALSDVNAYLRSGHHERLVRKKSERIQKKFL